MWQYCFIVYEYLQLACFGYIPSLPVTDGHAKAILVKIETVEIKYFCILFLTQAISFIPANEVLVPLFWVVFVILITFLVLDVLICLPRIFRFFFTLKIRLKSWRGVSNFYFVLFCLIFSQTQVHASESTDFQTSGYSLASFVTVNTDASFKVVF